MRVSIVICTLNRASSLGDTLEALRHQRHRDIEVVVVNGPSTDHTEEVLAEWRGLIKHERCPAPNLSMSRNIGIRAAAGDVVAFIDDDALPEFDWLVQALPAFADEDVAGVGGIVFDHTGMALQYRYSAANRFAETNWSSDEPFDDYSAPGSFWFPYLQGTNALFRRTALERVGGFDETYEYYLDETDLCCRLVDSGFRLRQLPDAPVHHKFLPSGIRDHQRIVTNWYPIVKNQVYFSYRHALDPFSEYDVLQHSMTFLESKVQDARFHEGAGRLPSGSGDRAAVIGARAIEDGLRIGRDRFGLRLGPVIWPSPPFLTFPTLDTTDRTSAILVSSSYTPYVSGGVARFISELAPAMAARGDEVRVITRSSDHSRVDLESGVWVHRINAESPSSALPDALAGIDEFSSAAADEIARILTWTTPQVVYGPVWDVELLATQRRGLLPTVLQVATPFSVALDGQGVSHSLLEQLERLERETFTLAEGLHANGNTVRSTMASRYGELADDPRWRVIPLGMADRPVPVERAQVVAFVGRFERRKGIDTLLAAIEQLAPANPDWTFVLAGEDRPLALDEEPVGARWAREHAHETWIQRVQMPGVLADDDVHELFARAAIAALPSRYESFGLVMVEAMMHGTPVVACSGSGVSDVVRDGVDGLLVEPGSASALAVALQMLMTNEVARSSMGANGRERFESAFDIAVCASNLSMALREAAAVPAGQAP